MIRNIDNWAVRRLGDIAEFRNGINYNKSSFGKGIKVIGVSNFQDYVRPKYGELDQINPDGIVTDRDLLQNGDIVFVRSNGNRNLIGRSLFIENISEHITHSAFTIRLRFTSSEVLPKFYAYCFRTSVIRQSLSAYGGGTNISNLNQDILRSLEIPCPSLTTQHKIASILSAYDDLIENNLHRIKILEEMAQNLYREWFVKFRFPGHENTRFVDSPLGKIPEGWRVVSFTDIADVLSGGTPKTSVYEYWNGNIPFFAPKDALDAFYVAETSKHITDIGLRKCNSKLYPLNTVFITARGTVGKVVLPSREMAMNQSCYALRGKNGIGQLFLFLVTKDKVDYLKKNTGGATFDTIVIDTFNRMQVVKPDESLIGSFEKEVNPVFALILNLLNRNHFLRKTRDLLLPKLISGEVDVSELDIQTHEEVPA